MSRRLAVGIRAPRRRPVPVPHASSLLHPAARRTPPSDAVLPLPSFVAAADRVAVVFRTPVAEVRRPAAAVPMLAAAVAERMAVAAPRIPAAVAVRRAAVVGRTVAAKGTVRRSFSHRRRRAIESRCHAIPERKNT